MSGWRLVSVNGSQTYSFPSGYKLKAGSAVKITSGPSANGDVVNTLKWTTANIWNNSGDSGQLIDSNGSIVSTMQGS